MNRHLVTETAKRNDMKLSTAIRAAIEAIDRVLKREYTFEANLHEAGLPERIAEPQMTMFELEA